MLGKFGILVVILIMVLIFYFVISFGAGVFSKGEQKPEIKKIKKQGTSRFCRELFLSPVFEKRRKNVKIDV